MDFKRKLLIYSSMLGLLTLIFIIASLIRALTSAPEGEILFPGFKSEAVRAVSLTDKSGSIELKKTGEEWEILYQGKVFEPDKSRLDQLITTFIDLRKTKVVSSQRANWPNFAIDEEQALHLVLRYADNSVAVDCYLGKGATTSSSQYLRLANAEEVLQVDKRLSYATSLKSWVKLRLFPEGITAETVKRVEVQSKISFESREGNLIPVKRNLSFVLVNTGEKKEEKLVWQVEGKTQLPLSSDKVSNLINSFGGFYADDVVVDPVSQGLDLEQTPLGTVTLTLTDGKSYGFELLQASSKEKGKYFVRSVGSKYIFTSTDWGVRNLVNGLEAYLEEGVLLKLN